jgi:hypothetical protein
MSWVPGVGCRVLDAGVLDAGVLDAGVLDAGELDKALGVALVSLPARKVRLFP